MKLNSALPWIHPLELHHTYQLLRTLPLAHKTDDEVELLADSLASVNSLLELNSLIRKLRQDANPKHLCANQHPLRANSRYNRQPDSKPR